MLLLYIKMGAYIYGVLILCGCLFCVGAYKLDVVVVIKIGAIFMGAYFVWVPITGIPICGISTALVCTCR